jgi:MFS family permease
MVVLDATVVNVALPSIQRDLGFSAANLLWVINASTLIFGGFLLLGGRATCPAGASYSSGASRSSPWHRC